MMVNNGNTLYINEYYDAYNSHIYSFEQPDKIVDTELQGKQLNILGEDLYYIDDNTIYRYAAGDESAEEVYKGGALQQLLAADNGSKVYLYFTEISGTQYYLQRLDTATNEKKTISAGQNFMLFTVHDNKIYYVNDKHEVWTVDMNGKKEKCIIKDSGANALCFVDDKMYLQTDDSVIEATTNGKVENVLPDVKPVFVLDENHISPIIGDDGKLYYIDSDTYYLYCCDLSDNTSEPVVEATCYNFELAAAGYLFYTTKETDVPATHMMTVSGDEVTDPVPMCFWGKAEAEKYEYGVYYCENATNNSLCGITDEEFYFIDEGTLYKSDLSNTGSSSNCTAITKEDTECCGLNVLSDGRLYLVENKNGTSYIVSTDEGLIYKGNDVHALEYYRRDSFEKLLFTDKAQNGSYYAYSINADGSALTCISPVACAPDSLDVNNNYIIYADEEGKHLYLAYATGQPVNEGYLCYTVSDDDLSICQASFHDTELVYISLNGSASDNRFDSINPITGEVLSDQKANIGHFVFCEGLYAVDPTDDYVYYYESPSKDLTKRTLVNDVPVAAVNTFEYKDTWFVIYQTKNYGYAFLVTTESSGKFKCRGLKYININDYVSSS